MRPPFFEVDIRVSGILSYIRVFVNKEFTMWHCAGCATEIGQEDLQNGHLCEKCRHDEYRDRRELGNRIQYAQRYGDGISPEQISIESSRISAKYSKFLHLDRE